MNVAQSEFSCTRDSLVIRGVECRPEGTSLPVVIVNHGFNGTYRDTLYYAEFFAQRGYAAYVFDFCGGSSDSTSDGRFQDMTVFTERADLEAVIDYISGLPYTDISDLTLMGCSQGGFISALYSAAHPDAVTRLIMFYPALSIPDDSRSGHMLAYSFDPANVPETIEPSPLVPFFKSAIGREYVTCVQDMDAFTTIAAYPGPVLILHGDSDGAVNVANSRKAVAAYEQTVPGRCRLIEIEGADHGFKPNEDLQAYRYLREFVPQK